MPLRTTLLAAALFGPLAACGDTFGEQAVFGAGTGAVAAGAVDANPVAGAAVGAAANVLYCEENPEDC